MENKTNGGAVIWIGILMVMGVMFMAPVGPLKMQDKEAAFNLPTTYEVVFEDDHNLFEVADDLGGHDALIVKDSVRAHMHIRRGYWESLTENEKQEIINLNRF